MRTEYTPHAPFSVFWDCLFLYGCVWVLAPVTGASAPDPEMVLVLSDLKCFGTHQGDIRELLRDTLRIMARSGLQGKHSRVKYTVWGSAIPCHFKLRRDAARGVLNL